MMAILLDRHLQSVANYLILSLALADLLVAVLVMPLGAVYEVGPKTVPHSPNHHTIVFNTINRGEIFFRIYTHKIDIKITLWSRRGEGNILK